MAANSIDSFDVIMRAYVTLLFWLMVILLGLPSTNTSWEAQALYQQCTYKTTTTTKLSSTTDGDGNSAAGMDSQKIIFSSYPLGDNVSTPFQSTAYALSVDNESVEVRGCVVLLQCSRDILNPLRNVRIFIHSLVSSDWCISSPLVEVYMPENLTVVVKNVSVTLCNTAFVNWRYAPLWNHVTIDVSHTNLTYIRNASAASGILLNVELLTPGLRDNLTIRLSAVTVKANFFAYSLYDYGNSTNSGIIRVNLYAHLVYMNVVPAGTPVELQHLTVNMSSVTMHVASARGTDQLRNPVALREASLLSIDASKEITLRHSRVFCTEVHHAAVTPSWAALVSLNTLALDDAAIRIDGGTLQETTLVSTEDQSIRALNVQANASFANVTVTMIRVTVTGSVCAGRCAGSYYFSSAIVSKSNAHAVVMYLQDPFMDMEHVTIDVQWCFLSANFTEGFIDHVTEVLNAVYFPITASLVLIASAARNVSITTSGSAVDVVGLHSGIAANIPDNVIFKKISVGIAVVLLPNGIRDTVVEVTSSSAAIEAASTTLVSSVPLESRGTTGNGIWNVTLVLSAVATVSSLDADLLLAFNALIASTPSYVLQLIAAQLDMYRMLARYWQQRVDVRIHDVVVAVDQELVSSLLLNATALAPSRMPSLLQAVSLAAIAWNATETIVTISNCTLRGNAGSILSTVSQTTALFSSVNLTVVNVSAGSVMEAMGGVPVEWWNSSIALRDCLLQPRSLLLLLSSSGSIYPSAAFYSISWPVGTLQPSVQFHEMLISMSGNAFVGFNHVFRPETMLLNTTVNHITLGCNGICSTASCGNAPQPLLVGVDDMTLLLEANSTLSTAAASAVKVMSTWGSASSDSLRVSTPAGDVTCLPFVSTEGSTPQSTTNTQDDSPLAAGSLYGAVSAISVIGVVGGGGGSDGALALQGLLALNSGACAPASQRSQSSASRILLSPFFALGNGWMVLGNVIVCASAVMIQGCFVNLKLRHSPPAGSSSRRRPHDGASGRKVADRVGYLSRTLRLEKAMTAARAPQLSYRVWMLLHLGITRCSVGLIVGNPVIPTTDTIDDVLLDESPVGATAVVAVLGILWNIPVAAGVVWSHVTVLREDEQLLRFKRWSRRLISTAHIPRWFVWAVPHGTWMPDSVRQRYGALVGSVRGSRARWAMYPPALATLWAVLGSLPFQAIDACAVPWAISSASAAGMFGAVVWMRPHRTAALNVLQAASLGIMALHCALIACGVVSMDLLSALSVMQTVISVCRSVYAVLVSGVERRLHDAAAAAQQRHESTVADPALCDDTVFDVGALPLQLFLSNYQNKNVRDKKKKVSRRAPHQRSDVASPVSVRDDYSGIKEEGIREWTQSYRRREEVHKLLMALVKNICDDGRSRVV